MNKLTTLKLNRNLLCLLDQIFFKTPVIKNELKLLKPIESQKDIGERSMKRKNNNKNQKRKNKRNQKGDNQSQKHAIKKPLFTHLKSLLNIEKNNY